MSFDSRWWRIGAYLLVAALAVAAVAVISGRSARRASEHAFDSVLADADQQIAIAAYDLADSLVADAATKARAEAQHLRVLKRALSIARGSGDWSRLDGVARAALAAIPGSTSLRRIAAYAALRVGEPRFALAAAESGNQREQPSAGFQFVAAEALVAAGVGVGGPRAATLVPALADLVTAVEQRDPDQLVALGRRFSSDLILDAVLLLAEAGDLTGGFELLATDLQQRSYDLPAFLISYDAGEYQYAGRRLDRYRAATDDDPASLLLAADLALHAARTPDAADIYRRVLSLAPDFSWHASVNLARILLDAGDVVAAFDVLDDALGRFPSTTAIGVAMAQLYSVAGRAGEADTLTSPLREAEMPLDVELAVLELDATVMGSERYTMRLWRLARDNPKHERLHRLLATRLLSVADLQGADLALRGYHRALGDVARLPSWWYELSGLAEASRRNLSDAVELLGRAAAAVPRSWSIRYNLALLHLAAGDPAIAAAELAEAERLLRALPTTGTGGGLDFDAALARVRTRVAEVRAQAGDFVAAQRELAFAVELDPSYVRARVLVNRLVADPRN